MLSHLNRERRQMPRHDVGGLHYSWLKRVSAVVFCKTRREQMKFTITIEMETDHMTEGKVEEFAHEMIDDMVSEGHIFPDEELKVVKVERKG